MEFLGSLPAQTGCDSVSLVVREIYGYQHENNSQSGITKWTKLEMTIGYFFKNIYSNLEFSPHFSKH